MQPNKQSPVAMLQQKLSFPEPSAEGQIDADASLPGNSVSHMAVVAGSFPSGSCEIGSPAHESSSFTGSSRKHQS